MRRPIQYPSDRIGDILGGQAAKTGLGLFGARLVATETDIEELGIAHQPWLNIRHSDSLAGKVGLEVSREVLDECLRRAVDVSAWVRIRPSYGADVDDMAGSKRDHVRDEGMGWVQKTGDVGLHDPRRRRPG